MEPNFSAPSKKLASMSAIVDIFPATMEEVLVLRIPNMVQGYCSLIQSKLNIGSSL